MQSKSQKIGRSFSDNASRYGQYAHAQKSASQKLLDALHIQTEIIDGLVLEIGSGPSPLQLTTSPCTIFTLDISESADIQGAMDYLPLKANTLNGVISSSAFQWSEDLGRLFINCAQILRYNGFLAVSMFVDGTLPELTKLQSEFGKNPGVIFHTPHNINNMLTEAGLTLQTSSQSTFTEPFDNAKQALKSIAHIGASPLVSQALPPSKVRDFLKAYSQSFDTTPSHTYSIYTFVARKESR